MRKILSAIIIDENYKNHDYEDVVLSKCPRYMESKFDLKILENCKDINKVLNEFRGIDCIV